MINKCRRRGNKTGKPKGDKTKGVKKPWVKPPQRQGRASRSSHHHFHFHRKFAYFLQHRAYYYYYGRSRVALPLSSRRRLSVFQCTSSSSKSVASQKQRNFLETQRNFLSSKRSFPSSKSVACVFVHNC